MCEVDDGIRGGGPVDDVATFGMWCVSMCCSESVMFGVAASVTNEGGCAVADGGGAFDVGAAT